MEDSVPRGMLFGDSVAAVRRIAQKHGLPADELYPSSAVREDWRGSDTRHLNETGKNGQEKIVGDFLLGLLAGEGNAKEKIL